MEFLYERVSDNRFCERARLIEWDASALLERGKFLPLIHSWTNKKFVCTADFAVSPTSSSVAVISPDGELNIMQIKDDKLLLKSQVQVLLDPYPELRLIEWNATETLLFATRSSAVIDVFEGSGMFLYKISMKDESQGTSQVIGQIRTRMLIDDSNFSDDIYALQIDGCFSAFRVGKQAYHRLFTVLLNGAPLCSMVHSHKFNIVITSSEFQHNSAASTEGADAAQFGLSVHRLSSGAPFVDCLKATSSKKAWHERIPFMSDKKAIIISMEISPDEKSLIAVTSSGDALLFSLPSLRLLRSLFAYEDARAPIQVAWLSNELIAMLHSTGQITKAHPTDYFDGVFSNQELNRLENCKRMRASSDTATYAITEIRNDNILTPEENKQRVGAELSLFFVFYTSFVLRLLKAFFSFFFGSDFYVDLNEKLGVEQSATLALYKTQILMDAEYIEKCLNDRKYDLALSLARSSGGAYELDRVYKRQWEDLKAAARISEQHIELLRCIHDKIWVLDECLRLNVNNLKLHIRILVLAESIVEDSDNERLVTRVRNAAQIMDVARAAVESDEEMCEMYLRYRTFSLVEYAFALAEEAHIAALAQLFKAHNLELRNYRLLILSAIPETVRPKAYLQLIPFCDKSIAPDENALVLDDAKAAKAAAAVRLDQLPPQHAQFAEFCLGNEDADDEAVLKAWCEKRAERIDAYSGIIEDCAYLIGGVIEHGCPGLGEAYEQWRLYEMFVRLSVSVNVTFKHFLALDAATAQSTIAKHIQRKDLIENLGQIIELIEAADNERGKAHAQVLKLVCAHSTRSFEVLDALRLTRPAMLTNEALTDCFLRSQLCGERLVTTMRHFDFHGNLAVAVELCASVPALAEQTFADIYDAMKEATRGRELMQRFVHGSCASATAAALVDEDWWRDLLSRSRQLQLMAFEKSVADEDILRLVCSEMLDRVCRDLRAERPPSQQAPFQVVVSLDSTAESADLLKQCIFEELIVEKSRAFLELAKPELEDANLRRATLVLDALRYGARMPRVLAAQKRALDVVRLCLELGSRRVPAMFAVCDRELLLGEIVATRNNYKNVKACADVARLLEFTSPAARALAACVSTALERNDMPTLRNFTRQLAKSARDFPVVYETAKVILEKELEDEELRDDALACVLHNCPESELSAMYEILSACRERKAQKATAAQIARA